MLGGKGDQDKKKTDRKMKDQDTLLKKVNQKAEDVQRPSATKYVFCGNQNM